MSNPLKHSPTNNLGFRVTTRLISWEQLVRDAEGERWNYPIMIYEMETRCGVVRFVSHDDAVTGPE